MAAIQNVRSRCILVQASCCARIPRQSCWGRRHGCWARWAQWPWTWSSLCRCAKTPTYMPIVWRHANCFKIAPAEAPEVWRRSLCMCEAHLLVKQMPSLWSMRSITTSSMSPLRRAPTTSGRSAWRCSSCLGQGLEQTLCGRPRRRGRPEKGFAGNCSLVRAAPRCHGARERAF